jgi:hypothetical protein
MDLCHRGDLALVECACCHTERRTAAMLITAGAVRRFWGYKAECAIASVTRRAEP